MQTQRLDYIDALRAVAIGFIVFGHVPMYCYGELGIANAQQQLVSLRALTSMVQLPVFFFVSGFLAKLLGGGKSQTVRKLQQLIVPAVLVGGFHLAWTGGDVAECLTDKFKGGYWFTLTLFECFLLHWLTVRLWLRLRRRRGDGAPDGRKAYAALCLTMAAVAYGLSLPQVAGRVETLPVVGWLSLPQLRYYLYFVMGHLVRQNLPALAAWRWRDGAVALCLAVFAALALTVWGWRMPVGGLLYHVRLVAFEMSALLLLFAVFYKHRRWFALDGRTQRTLRFLGHRTLDIYLLHYFFIPAGLSAVGAWFVAHPAPVAEALLALAYSAAVIALSLAASEAIRTSRLAARWLLGTK